MAVPVCADTVSLTSVLRLRTVFRGLRECWRGVLPSAASAFGLRTLCYSPPSPPSIPRHERPTQPPKIAETRAPATPPSPASSFSQVPCQCTQRACIKAHRIGLLSDSHAPDRPATQPRTSRTPRTPGESSAPYYIAVVPAPPRPIHSYTSTPSSTFI